MKCWSLSCFVLLRILEPRLPFFASRYIFSFNIKCLAIIMTMRWYFWLCCCVTEVGVSRNFLWLEKRCASWNYPKTKTAYILLGTFILSWVLQTMRERLKIMTRYLGHTYTLTHTHTLSQKEIESTILLNHLTQHIYIVGVLQVFWCSFIPYKFSLKFIDFFSINN